jgi:sugar phosphate isomerase/epimerase
MRLAADCELTVPPQRARDSRRAFCAAAGSALASWLLVRQAKANPESKLRLRYILGSCLYGYTDIKEILPEVAKTGATAIDLWPKVHGSQREQLAELGEAAFAQLLEQHQVSLGCITQYPLGPFGLHDEMRLAGRLGCGLLVTGASGPKGLAGAELKGAVARFAEQMKPHLEVAEEHGVTIAIENHVNSLIDSPDSLKWLAEFRSSPRLAIALAPYHLPQDAQELADLIRSLGSSIAMFYAWEHGQGCMQKLPKEQELLQMPGRGELDFAPLLGALEEIHYAGWTEIFMHPFPRGIPILGSTAEVTTEINRARRYLEETLVRSDAR